MSLRQWLYIVPLRLRLIVHRQQVDGELRDELQYHLDMKIQEDGVQGVSREEARRTALLAIGGLDQRKEECRDARGFRFIGEMRKDFGYAVRQLGHHPGFAILAILVLALGIGANTAVVSIIDQLIFRPLPVLETERLVSISQSSDLDYFDLRNDGRDFTDRDDTPESAGTIMINETMARRFWPGANPLAMRLQLGKTLGDVRKNPEQLYEVIGVVKDAGYAKVWDGPKPYAYFTRAQLGLDDGPSRLHARIAGNSGLMINPIRKVFESSGPEAKVLDARLLSAEMEALLSRERSSASVLSLLGGLAFLLAGIGLYGVVSCLAASRRREFGICLALGAQKGNIVRLVIREAVLTILVGLAIGIPLSVSATRFLQSRLHGISSLDPVVYVVTSVLWIALAVVAAIVPAKRALSNPINPLRFE